MCPQSQKPICKKAKVFLNLGAKHKQTIISEYIPIFQGIFSSVRFTFSLSKREFFSIENNWNTSKNCLKKWI